MNKIQILSIGRDPVLLQKLSRFINENPEWESNATIDDETAIQLFYQLKFDMILLINELENESVKKFRSLFSFDNPEMIFIKHTGDSTEILGDEIREALQKRNTPVNIVDDIFKKKE